MTDRRNTSPASLADEFAALTGDERAIADLLIGRLVDGRKNYGPWSVTDGRDYLTEALNEDLDGMMYRAAELVRMRRERGSASESQVETLAFAVKRRSSQLSHVRSRVVGIARALRETQDENRRLREARA